MPTPNVLDVAAPVTHAGDVADLRYEVMYFLDLADETIGAFKEGWGAIGDSIVVVGGEGLWNCHVHTNDIGAAVEVALDVGGRPRQIRVTDLFEEVAEEHAVREAAMRRRRWRTDEPSGDALLPPVTCAVVAVASGGGLVELFGQLGVQGVITGGQTLNPSTAELLDAVERVNADEVVVLPNNKNIIPVAEQLDALTNKRVVVVPTTSMPAGLAALVVYDPEDGADANAASMGAAAEGVTTGEVTRAVRDTTSEAGPIAEGDWIGLVRGDGIVAVGVTLDGVVAGLLGELVGRRARAADGDRGAGLVGRPHRGDRAVGGRAASRRRGRGASRRPAAVPLSVRCRMNEPLTLPDLGEIDVARLKGVGDKKLDALHAIGVETVLDLLTTYPRRWVDRTNEARLADLEPGREALVLVTVHDVVKRTTRNRRTMVTATVGDGSGRLHVVFFNQPWRERQLREGLQVALYGKADVYRGGLQMTNPVVDLIGDRTGRIVPIYPQSEKVALSTWEIAGWVEDALAKCQPRGIADPVPAARARPAAA